MLLDGLRFTDAKGRARAILRHLTERADRARDERRYLEAATLYAEALRLAPERVGLHVQQGHMLKESGDLAGAELAYMAAAALTPDDPDLALQLGHFYKVAGKPQQAERAYARALELKPDWSVPERELTALRSISGPADVLLPPQLDHHVGSLDEDGVLAPATVARLVPELAPRAPGSMLHDHRVGLEVRRFGHPEHGKGAELRTVRGVEAIRGFCISPRPITEVQILLNGLALYRGPVRGGYVLPQERNKSRALKYVFNVWIDFSHMAPGRYAAMVRCIDTEQDVHSFEDDLVIEPPLSFAEYESSDTEIPISDPDPATLMARIRALPSVVRPAERTTLAQPKAVLIMRTDQLGDIISSTPSVRRLRELMPEARMVGLLTAANVDLARTLNLFDEIIVANFPDDKVERRRVMPLAEQERLRQRLEPYAFDLAIDLSQSDVSRPLLVLSGAKFLYGVGSGGHWPWLTAEFGLNTHDHRNRMDIVPHSAKTLALVEALGVMLRDSFQVARRDDLSRDRLELMGLGANDRYVVLHMGARIEFSRWPKYAELAAMLLDKTDAKVVMMTEDRAIRPTLPARLTDDPRFIFLDERTSFDDFDALVSFAAALVGNDSGPKHLASFRGVPAVTLFTARINWKEWGQERGGVIISRRVPCAGCALFHDADECGQEFTCIRDISVREVFDATVAAGHLDGQER